MASFDQFYISICYESTGRKPGRCHSTAEQFKLLSQLTPSCLKDELPILFSSDTTVCNPSMFQEMCQKSVKIQTYLLRFSLYCQKNPDVIDQIEACCSDYLLTAPDIRIEGYLAACRKWISRLNLPNNDPLYDLLMNGFSRYSQIPKLMTWYYLDACTDSVYSLSAIYQAYVEKQESTTQADDSSPIGDLADLIHKLLTYFNPFGHIKREGSLENLLSDCCAIANLACSLKASVPTPLHSMLHEVETAALSAADSLYTNPNGAERSLKWLLSSENHLRMRSKFPVISPVS